MFESTICQKEFNSTASATKKYASDESKGYTDETVNTLTTFSYDQTRTEGTNKVKLGAPSIPTNNSTLIFRGWTLNSDAATAIEPDIKEDTEIDLSNGGIYYASYSKIITVSFDPNGGTGSMESLSAPGYFKYDQSCGTPATIEIPDCTFGAPENMEFDYWGPTSSGGSKIDLGDNSFPADTTIFAIWKTKGYWCSECLDYFVLHHSSCDTCGTHYINGEETCTGTIDCPQSRIRRQLGDVEFEDALDALSERRLQLRLLRNALP